VSLWANVVCVWCGVIVVFLWGLAVVGVQGLLEPHLDRCPLVVVVP
jgi:hypothetical protein